MQNSFLNDSVILTLGNDFFNVETMSDEYTTTIRFLLSPWHFTQRLKTEVVTVLQNLNVKYFI